MSCTQDDSFWFVHDACSLARRNVRSTEPGLLRNLEQSNERCAPTRTDDVTLHIDQRDPDLRLWRLPCSEVPGRPGTLCNATVPMAEHSVSIGADGDEFHTSVAWNGPSLLFSVEEHEDGRILLSRETWTLIDNGSA